MIYPVGIRPRNRYVYSSNCIAAPRRVISSEVYQNHLIRALTENVNDPRAEKLSSKSFIAAAECALR